MWGRNAVNDFPIHRRADRPRKVLAVATVWIALERGHPTRRADLRLGESVDLGSRHAWADDVLNLVEDALDDRVRPIHDLELGAGFEDQAAHDAPTVVTRRPDTSSGDPEASTSRSRPRRR